MEASAARAVATACDLIHVTGQISTSHAPYKYGAFLSYRTSDARQAAWLHAQLERYVVPRDLVGRQGDHGPVPARLGRIFRDRDEARSAEDIETVIARELSQAQQLIVLCTPAAASAGSWVPREIELFRASRPGAPIHAVIGAGTPPECFPTPLLRPRGDGGVDAPLAADIRPLREGGHDGPRKGLIRLVAGLLGVGFDDLWRREERRRRRQRILVVAQLAGAAAVAWMVTAGAALYRTHALVDVDLAPLAGLARDIHIVTTEETPEQNGTRIVGTHSVRDARARIVVPTSNVIVRVHATYADGADRGLAVHLLPSPGLSPTAKRVTWRLPDAPSITAHPGMAFIPPVAWVHGRENSARTNAVPFWIDLRPPTVEQYEPIARRLLQDGRLDAEQSFLLTALQQQAGVKATGLEQVSRLADDIGDILTVVAQANSPYVSAPGDIVAGLVDLPCRTCPALMTRYEAEVYCHSRGMRLPTSLEWELAVRGVDGRVYPWGNRFDPSRANVPGLPDKGALTPRLVPVDAHADSRSPFGLIDTVGNAGDWVVNDEGAYERVYMGATYRYNPEDATAFRMLPVTDSDYLVQPITARCVDDGRESPR